MYKSIKKLEMYEMLRCMSYDVINIVYEYTLNNNVLDCTFTEMKIEDIDINIVM